MSAELPPSVKAMVGHQDPAFRDPVHDPTGITVERAGRVAAALILVGGILTAQETLAPKEAAANSASATIGMPFAGRWAYSNPVARGCGPESNETSHPECHEIYFGDWSTDLYAAAGTEVRLNVNSSAALTFSWDVTASGSCGQTRRVNVLAGGSKVGRLHVTHLNEAASIDVVPKNGMVIGKIANLACNPGGTGKHVHIEVDNEGSNTHSCYTNHSTQAVTAGMELPAGTSLGLLGSNNTGTKQPCASGPPPIPTSNPAKTHVLLDGLGRVQARDTIGEQGWVEETDPGGAVDIATGGGVQLILDHVGRIWSRNTLGKEGWRKETENPNSAVEIEMGSDGTMMLRDHASQVYAKKYGSNTDWVRETDPGSAKDIETNGGVQVIRDYADQIWIKNGGISWGGWWPASEQYYARELEVGTDSTIMVRRYDDSVFTRKEGDWVRESWPGGAAEIATNGGLRVVRNYAGEIWQKSGPLHTEGWQPDAASGSAVEVQVTDDGTRIIRDHINRIYARGMGPNDQYVPEAGPNSATMVSD